MDRSVSVRTPESIAFDHDLAGIGSRFLAVTVDMLIQAAIFAAAAAGLLLAAPRSHIARSAADVIFAVLAFAVFFAYFVLFEAFWNGRTPGKKLMGLRVVRDGGYPIDFASSAIRNLVRAGEFVLGFYAIGAICALVSPQNKRVGDVAAGTLVVRETPVASLDAIVAQAQNAPKTPMLTEEEHALVGEFLARRNAMARNVRNLLAARIADRVRPRVSADLQRLGDEELLSRLGE